MFMERNDEMYVFFVLEAENIKYWIKIKKLLRHDLLRALNDA